MASSGVYHISFALFPGQDLEDEFITAASDELAALVKKQYPHWVRFRTATKLSHKFTITDEEEFLEQAKAGLIIHLKGDKLQSARTIFKRKFEEHLQELESGAVRGNKLFSLDSYWDSATVDCPALSVVVRTLQKCSASEAAIERFFSLEAILRSSLRNSLSLEVVENMLFIKQNYNALTGNPEAYEPLVQEIKYD